MRILQFRRILLSQSGVTIIELLTALFITGVITTATLQFYIKMHNQSEVQQLVSDSHLICRNTLADIKKNLRMAGYKLTGHPAYEISGDSMGIYRSEINPVDSLLYYLEEFNTEEYSGVPNLPTGRKLYKLLKQVNSDSPAILADYIVSLRYVVIDPSNIQVVVVSQSERADEDFNQDNGYRTFTLSERIKIRNAI